MKYDKTIIAIDKLSKTFKSKNTPSFTAVDQISFSVQKGERVAFIGPNGAGKSTTLKMLTGILHPSNGKAQVAGFTPWLQRQQLAYRIGIVFGQRSQLWYQLPVKDSFELLAKIYNLPTEQYRQTLEELINTLELKNFINKPVKSLSLGQRMRCEIAASLLHRPSILFLDEPTIGLDITAKALLRDHLKKLAEKEETTIILTSHDMGDIEEICQRVVLINHGKILIDQAINHLKMQLFDTKQITFLTAEESPQLHIQGVVVTEQKPHHLTVQIEPNKTPIDEIIHQALKSLTVKDLSIENPPLESIISHLYSGARL